jgi:two-component system cell cycle sensor histidine kinase/response regulator CckA
VADLKPGEPMRDDLQEINGAGKRAAALTRQLLAFSRRQVLQPRVVSLNDIFAGMEKMLRRLLGEDVELRALTAGSPGRVLLDPGQMEQVIMNLAVNARDAMPNGGQLTIETSEVVLSAKEAAEHGGVKPGPHVMLAVTDTGTGMDAATLARVFEPFFTTKEAGHGTGLGLSTVFGIVKQSGGTIWARSEPGKGTTFWTCFPLALPGAVGAVSERPSGFPEGQTLHGSETILVVEDEEAVRGLACKILRRYGYEVLDAQSGGDALIACEQHDAPIALLLADVVMARMSGPQLAARLVLVRPEMKVLFMSGYTGGSGLEDSAFIQKPITPVVLARRVRELLGTGPRGISTRADPADGLPREKALS